MFVFRLIALARLAIATSAALAHDMVKLSDYVVDVMRFAEYAKDAMDVAKKAAAEHTRDCS